MNRRSVSCVVSLLVLLSGAVVFARCICHKNQPLCDVWSVRDDLGQVSNAYYSLSLICNRTYLGDGDGVRHCTANGPDGEPCVWLYLTNMQVTVYGPGVWSVSGVDACYTNEEVSGYLSTQTNWFVVSASCWPEEPDCYYVSEAMINSNYDGCVIYYWCGCDWNVLQVSDSASLVCESSVGLHDAVLKTNAGFVVSYVGPWDGLTNCSANEQSFYECKHYETPGTIHQVTRDAGVDNPQEDCWCSWYVPVCSSNGCCPSWSWAWDFSIKAESGCPTQYTYNDGGTMYHSCSNSHCLVETLPANTTQVTWSSVRWELTNVFGTWDGPSGCGPEGDYVLAVSNLGSCTQTWGPCTGGCPTSPSDWMVPAVVHVE